MKKILVIHYSQSGQLTEIINNITSTFNTNNIEVDFHQIEMETPFPFPWPKKDFFGVFPESFLETPSQIKPIPDEIINKNYDLIILGYQVWYLTPSIPFNSFLNTSSAKKILKDTPVITVIGCRNMWLMAQEKVKKKLKNLDAKLVGNIALEDRHINHISVITIVQWMFTGEKKRFLGIFPKPGVSQKDINNSTRFGPVISKHLLNNDFSTLQNELIKLKAVTIKPFLITVDKRANFLFSKWANLIASKGQKNSSKRDIWLKIFNYYLLFAIWIIAPIVFVLFLLTYIFNYVKIKQDIVYYKSVTTK